VDKCLEDVAEAEVYLGIFAWRYGYVPRRDNPERLSITEMEFRHAVRLGKSCLLFLLDEQAPWPRARMEQGEAAARIEALRNEMRNGDSFTLSFFTDCTDLAAKATAALHNWERRRQEQERPQREEEQRQVEAQHARIAAGLDAQRRELVEESERRQGEERERVVGQRPSALIDYFKDRVEQREAVGRLLADPATRVVTVIGRAGMGKTALASKILADLERNIWPHVEDERPVDGIVYLGVGTAGISLERLFLDCARMLGGEQARELEKVWASPRLRTAEKVEHLLDAMRGGLYVILLDHLEDLLDADGQITDPDLRTFFETSLRREHDARLLITSRVPLAFPREVMRFDQRVPLQEGVPIPEGIAILRELDPNNECGLRDASDKQLAQVVERLHGWPRALEVFAGILRDDPLASLEDMLARFYEQEEVAEHLIEEGYKRLDASARQVMQALAVFGQPVKLLAVDFLLQPFAPGLDVPEVARRLIRAHMVSADRASGTVRLNPIDRDYAYAELPEQGAYSRATLHRRAAEYYRQLRAPRERWDSFADLEPQLLEFEHLVRAVEYDAASEVLSEIDVDYLIWRGHARRVQAMRAQLEGRLQDRRQQMLHAFSLAHLYTYMGPLERSLGYFRQARDIAAEVGDRRIERLSAGGLGEAFRRLGRIEDAVSWLSQALEMYRGTESPQEESWYMLMLGLAQSYQGNLQAAVALGNEMLELARQSGDLLAEGRAHDVLSLAYLVMERWEETVRHTQAGGRLYQQLPGAQDALGYVLNAEGVAFAGLGRLEEAVERFRQTRVMAREIDNLRLEGFCLFNLAYVQHAQRDLDAALETADQAVKVLATLGAAEAEPARRLADALRASTAGDPAAAAAAWLACARSVRELVDLHGPPALAAQALRAAEAAGLAELAAQARALIAESRARLVLPQAP
jgi:tetratricopeptide (TPR) repeat protein